MIKETDINGKIVKGDIVPKKNFPGSHLPQFRYIKPVGMGRMYQVGCAYCENEWITDDPTESGDLTNIRCTKCNHEK